MNIPWSDARFVTCDAGLDHVAHIATPAWMCGESSLFTCYHKVLFCGNSATGRSLEPGRKYVYTYHDAIPDGYKLCQYCARRLAADVLPFVDLTP